MGYSTKTKTAMMNFIKKQKNSQFSAADIYEYIINQGYKVNKTTVYRNLERLVEENIVLQFKYIDKNNILYQYAGEHEECERHLHLKCKNCGKVIHLDCHFMDEFSNHLLQEHEFEIECKESCISGLCKECKQK
ncbi:MAG: Fur family transcriptional regulator [Lachnospiraceae bacterium]